MPIRAAWRAVHCEDEPQTPSVYDGFSEAGTEGIRQPPIRPATTEPEDKLAGGEQVVGPEEVLVGEPADGAVAGGDELFGDALEGEAVGDVEEIADSEAEQELAPKRVSPDPGRPTQSEIDDHNVDHLPFRCWCEECMKGRGTGEQHRRGACSAIPIIAFDYLFITDRGIMRRAEL